MLLVNNNKKGNQKRKGKEAAGNKALISMTCRDQPSTCLGQISKSSPRSSYSHSKSNMPWDPVGSTFKQIQNATTTGTMPREDYCNMLKNLPDCTLHSFNSDCDVDEGSFSKHRTNCVLALLNAPTPWISHLTQSKPQVLNLTCTKCYLICPMTSLHFRLLLPSPRPHLLPAALRLAQGHTGSFSAWNPHSWAKS